MSESPSVSELEEAVERLNDVYADELDRGDAEFELWLDEIEYGPDDTKYRLRVEGVDHSVTSMSNDIGPLYSTTSEMEAFLEGLEKAGRGAIGRAVKNL